MREEAIRDAIEKLQNDDSLTEVSVSMGNGFGVILIKKENDK